MHTLQLTSGLSQLIIVGEPKIFEIYLKSEENYKLLSHSFVDFKVILLLLCFLYFLQFQSVVVLIVDVPNWMFFSEFRNCKRAEEVGGGGGGGGRFCE